MSAVPSASPVPAVVGTIALANDLLVVVLELGFGGGRLRRGEVLGVAGDLLERLTPNTNKAKC